jgi:hypothetical protein
MPGGKLLEWSFHGLRGEGDIKRGRVGTESEVGMNVFRSAATDAQIHRTFKVNVN